MKLSISAAVLRGILIGLLLFGAVSAFGGGVLGAALDGGGVPLSYLDGTPFTDYLVPGLVLGAVIGGTQLAGAIGLLRRTSWALIATVVAGFGMMIWIFVEIALIRQYSDLQSIYFTLGALELILVYALLGLASTLVRGLVPAQDRVSR
ncbi:hypothetical protein RCH16_003509 [Cryobacterium sp. MP_M5]|uniref:hypothetical protein n=1 Tax=unclassified Cryobacterium TaxID=2649013 RepID=UPI0018CA9719|nr:MULTISPECIES: hypothetical protein [unclassified Cryobacterium]MBG6060052.1 hypothetical protein [Cryobacterium sp. MP_M3]MEC5178470.1 hypothetical protein [Cryobacterium sp. MP_M5]